MVLLGITYLTSYGDCGLIWREQLEGSPLDCNLMRGVLEMGIGVLLAYLYEQKMVSFQNHAFVVNVGGLVGLMGLLLIALSHDNYDTIVLFLVPMLILGCVNAKSWMAKVFRGKAWARLGGLSMYMYFIHAFVSASYYIVASRFPMMAEFPNSGMLVAYLLVCLLAGYVLKIVSGHLYQKTFAK